jgi:DNA polymerase beta
VPTKSSGAALLALTGDVEFNKDIRMRAIERGLHLNEFGLWRWQGENGGEGEETERGYWEMVKVETEEEILRELDMTWIEPEKRNFAFVVGKGDGRGQGKRGSDKQKRMPKKKRGT